MEGNICSLCGRDNCSETGEELVTIKCVECGTYKITRDAMDDLPAGRKLHDQLTKVSSYTRYRTIQGLEPIALFIYDASQSDITPRSTIAEIIDQFPNKVTDRMDKALMNLSKLSKFHGDKVALKHEDYTIFYPEIKDFKSAFFIFKQLVDEAYLVGNVAFPSEVTITVKGWNRIYELERGTSESTRRAFIAMWFSPEMNDVLESGFKKAIKDAKYDPIRIDEKQHNGKIDDEIIAEIRRSKFVVCDFTGHRGGVYFEAGFAMGLGVPVIWCCKEDDLKEIHFDTRQYNHIVWKDEEDLYRQLYNRIRATIV